MEYNISDTDLQIINSYQISKFKMLSILQDIKLKHPNSKVWDRSMFNLIMEWCSHNLAYAFGIYKDRTKDVDLNTPNDLPEWKYVIVGIIGFILIN